MQTNYLDIRDVPFSEDFLSPIPFIQKMPYIAISLFLIFIFSSKCSNKIKLAKVSSSNNNSQHRHQLP
jgi:hypothetical protein